MNVKQIFHVDYILFLLQKTNQQDNASYDSSPEEEFGEFESKGESLLRLVAPELENLAANWLAALRDHALLSLPPGSWPNTSIVQLESKGDADAIFIVF